MTDTGLLSCGFVDSEDTSLNYSLTNSPKIPRGQNTRDLCEMNQIPLFKDEITTIKKPMEGIEPHRLQTIDNEMNVLKDSKLNSLTDMTLKSPRRYDSLILPKSYYPLMVGTLSSYTSSWVSPLSTYSYQPTLPFGTKNSKKEISSSRDFELKPKSQLSFMTDHRSPIIGQMKTIDLQEHTEDLGRILLCLYYCLGAEMGPYSFNEDMRFLEICENIDRTSSTSYRDIKIFEMTLNLLQSQVIGEMSDSLLSEDLNFQSIESLIDKGMLEYYLLLTSL